jgi:hypothetical protein
VKQCADCSHTHHQDNGLLHSSNPNIDPNCHEDLVAGALATVLFWALGKVHELIHAERHPRMKLDSVQEAENGITGKCSLRIFLERAKVKRPGEMQFLNPLQYLGKANPQLWMTMLLYSISTRSFVVSSPWQISEDRHADSKWLFSRIYPSLRPSDQKLGSSSFRAGEYSQMAYMG